VDAEAYHLTKLAEAEKERFTPQYLQALMYQVAHAWLGHVARVQADRPTPPAHFADGGLRGAAPSCVLCF
jgi:hypothetical protein